MLEREYPGQNCSLARALEIVGERWTMLIIRDAFLGLRRFDQFQESLGIARNVLTDRLNWLVDVGILERVRYGQRPIRHEYQLTAKGRDLLLPLTAFRQWGDKYLSQKPPALLRRKSDGEQVVAALVAKGSGALRAEQLELVPGPGATRAQDLWWRDSRSDTRPS
jgi:DNA-binding HxlR family transcriptional regulator